MEKVFKKSNFSSHLLIKFIGRKQFSRSILVGGKIAIVFIVEL
jgi:hypothetical protein